MRRKRALSQNFLKDPSFAEKMVEELNPQPSDVVVEVGPGEGIISQLLLERASRVILVEKDRLLCEKLPEILKSKNVTIVKADILKVPLSELSQEKVLLISNLPFSITSDFFVYLIENRFSFKKAIVTFQREFAQRLYAKPGTQSYAWQSVAAQIFFHVTPLFNIPPHAFKPKPSVTSQVVRIEPNESSWEIDESKFVPFVRRIFQNRKKKLSSVVPRGNFNQEFSNLLEKRVYKASPEEILALFQK